MVPEVSTDEFGLLDCDVRRTQGEANPFGGAPSGVKKGSKSMKVPSKASATQANPFGGE